MFKRIENPINPFNRYFKEADDEAEDQVSVTVAPRSNRGSDYNDENTNIKVAPRSNRGNDYGEDDTDTPEEPSDGGEVPDPDTEGETDYGSDNSTDEPVENDNEGDSSGDGGDTDAVDAPETEGDSDYGSDEGDSGGESSEDSGDSDSESSEENSDDAQKRYTMYLRYLRLYDVLENMLEKLRYIVKDDPDENAVIIKVTDNLTTLKENMYDYMVMKFKSAQYVEIRIYFETIINCIRLNFVLIRNNKIILKQ